MVFGLIAAVVGALGALLLWMLAQRKLAVSEERAAEAATEARSKIEHLSSELETSEKTTAATTANLAELKSEKRRLMSDLRTTETQLETATVQLNDSNDSVASLSSELAATTEERDKIAAKLVRNKEALSESQKKDALDSLSGASPIRASTLWDLELTRSARTWRNSVATNPEVASTPFDNAEDPLRSAVEVEADALREDVGAAVRVDWRADAISDPARSHLVLRLAQELMASAAREPQPTVLVVEGQDELSLRIEPDNDSGDSVITLSPPKIVSSLVDVSSESGLIVTLRSTSLDLSDDPHHDVDTNLELELENQ